MSNKNFISYGDAETLLTQYASDINAKQPKSLSAPITIKNANYNTVETTLEALVNSVNDGKSLLANNLEKPV